MILAIVLLALAVLALSYLSYNLYNKKTTLRDRLDIMTSTASSENSSRRNAELTKDQIKTERDNQRTYFSKFVETIQTQLNKTPLDKGALQSIINEAKESYLYDGRQPIVLPSATASDPDANPEPTSQTTF